MPYHKPLHCGARLVLAAMLGLAAPQPLLSGQVITPAELPQGLLRSFDLPMKVVSEISFINHRRPELSRRLRATWYRLHKEGILHYFHRDGEVVVYPGTGKLRYSASKCDPLIERYFEDGFADEYSAMMPYAGVGSFVSMIAEQPTAKLTMERGAGLTTFTLAYRLSQNSSRELLTRCVVDDQGRPVSYSKGHRLFYLKSPDGSPLEYYYLNCFFSDYFELPGGLSFPRIVKGSHRYDRIDHEWTTRVEEVTLLAEGTTSREILRQLTQHLPLRNCEDAFWPRDNSCSPLMARRLTARTILVVLVATLSVIWLVARLRGRRI